jgi:cell division protein FtsW
VLFLLFGQIMLYSATGVLGLQRYGSEFYYSIRQASCAIIGLGMMIAISHIRYQTWGKLAYLLLIAQTVLIASLYTGLGHLAGGSTRWLRIAGVVFQPCELAKITLPIYVAYLLARRHKVRFTVRRWTLHLLPIVFLLVLVLMQPDLGSTILLTAITLGIFFIAGIRPIYIFSLLGGGTAFFLFSMLHSEYRRRRLFAFLNPWADPRGSGFQAIQSFLSFHNGRLFGMGLGNGNSKLFYLPEVHTDFIYSLVGEELGFVGALAVLLAFVYFAYLLFRVAFKAKEPFGCYLAFGLSLALVLQIVINLGSVTGLLPVKGFPLPFLSWGRSALVVNLLMVGILLNIVRQSGIIQKPVSPTASK